MWKTIMPEGVEAKIFSKWEKVCSSKERDQMNRHFWFASKRIWQHVKSEISDNGDERWCWRLDGESSVSLFDAKSDLFALQNLSKIVETFKSFSNCFWMRFLKRRNFSDSCFWSFSSKSNRQVNEFSSWRWKVRKWMYYWTEDKSDIYHRQ
jgi:hypothetical protein